MSHESPNIEQTPSPRSWADCDRSPNGTADSTGPNSSGMGEGLRINECQHVGEMLEPKTYEGAEMIFVA